MNRYKILYSKSGLPMTSWKSSKEEAEQMAEKLLSAGYVVTIFEYSADCFRIISGGVGCIYDNQTSEEAQGSNPYEVVGAVRRKLQAVAGG